MDAVNDGLIGVDPDDTLEVSFGGAKFTLGVVPAGIWEGLMMRYMMGMQEARQRSLQRLIAQGIDPSARGKDENGKPLEKEITELDLATSADVQWSAESINVHAEAVRYGLKKHEKFLRRNLQPVPLAFEDFAIDGARGQRLAEETQRFYRANSKIIQHLFNELTTLNKLGGEAKKA